MEALARKEKLGLVNYSSLEFLIQAAQDSRSDESGRNFNGYNILNILSLGFEIGLCRKEVVTQNLHIEKLDERRLIDLFGNWANNVENDALSAMNARPELDASWQERQRRTPVDNVDMGMNRKTYQFQLKEVNRYVHETLNKIYSETLRLQRESGISYSRFTKWRYDINYIGPLYQRFLSVFPGLCTSKQREHLPNQLGYDLATYDRRTGALFSAIGNKTPLTKRIDQHFNESQPLPLPINYCVQSVIDAKGVKDFSLTSWADSELCGNHASLIIGQRKNMKNGRCEYLIRNSWGTGTEPDSDGVEWETEHNAGKRNYTGNMWVDRESFVKNLVHEVYFMSNRLPLKVASPRPTYPWFPFSR